MQYIESRIVRRESAMNIRIYHSSHNVRRCTLALLKKFHDI